MHDIIKRQAIIIRMIKREDRPAKLEDALATISRGRKTYLNLAQWFDRFEKAIKKRQEELSGETP